MTSQYAYNMTICVTKWNNIDELLKLHWGFIHYSLVVYNSSLLMSLYWYCVLIDRAYEMILAICDAMRRHWTKSYLIEVIAWRFIIALHWRHNGRDSVSNHQPYDCLLNRLFRHRKHQSSAWLAFVWGIHRGPVNSPHKWPVTRKIFPFDDVIMDEAAEKMFNEYSWESYTE